MMLNPGSLAFRLILSAMLWSAIALAAAGLVLTELYRGSLERGFDERLIVYHKTIAGLLASTPEGLPDIGSLGEPRYLLPLTGWYWVIRDTATGQTVLASRSLFGEVLDVPVPPGDGTVLSGYIPGPGGAELRAVIQRIRMGAERQYDVLVTSGTAELNQEIASFRLKVFATLTVFAAGLVAATVLQVRLALKPLDLMRASLAAIREGRAERLEGSFPREIAPLGNELNALIEANGAIVERARSRVGNLAHALKTPLSVMLNEARGDPSPLAEKVTEMATSMRAEVDRYLDQARMAAERRLVGATAEVMQAVDSIARVLGRVYIEKDLAIETHGPEDLKARMERRDLDELLGVLMDNACKYGGGAVHVTVTAATLPSADRPMLSIEVDDDGTGLPPDKYQDVLGRGRRLDETVPGSGLGLSIADEILESYGGRMALSSSPLGGLKVTVVLPQS